MQSRSQKLAVKSLSLVALVLAASCASRARVVTNEHPDAAFGEYRTYGFPPVLGTDEDGYRTALGEHLRTAASREMEDRGYVHASDPDLVVDFSLYAWDELREEPTTVPVRTITRDEFFGGYATYEKDVKRVRESALTVKVLDRRRRLVVWEGARIRPLRRSDREHLDELAVTAMAEVFRGYPYVAGRSVPLGEPAGSTAYDEYRPLAERGEASAQFLLGVMASGGYGTPQDHREAARWFRLSAEQGYGLAQSKLGLLHLDGRGIARDYDEARTWLERAAEQDVASAQYALGWMHLEGRGVPQDEAEAARWLHLAADQGLAEAQINLGLMYLQGRGVAKDDAESVRWYGLAAQGGDPRAQARLAMMYEHGRGVPADPVAAYMWYALAAELGEADAAVRRDVLARSMGADELAEAKARARAWKQGDWRAEPLASRPVSPALEAGDRAFRDGRYGDAVERYREAVAEAPEDGARHRILSEALFAAGDYEQASRALRHALELAPELAATEQRAPYGDPSDLDAQLAALESYLELHFADDGARLLLAAGYLSAGRAEDCLALLEDAYAAEVRDTAAGRALLDAARARSSAN